MQEIPCKPPLFKVGDRVTIVDVDFCRVFPFLKHLQEKLIGQNGTISKFYEGKPAIVDDEGTLRNFGTASFYHVTLDNPPVGPKNEPINDIPLHDKELKKLEDN